MASRKTSSKSKRRRSTTGRRRSAARKPFKITRPGALTRAKKPGESTGQAARRLKAKGSPLQKRQANFYLNLLAPANRKRRKRKTTKPRKRR